MIEDNEKEQLYYKTALKNLEGYERFSPEWRKKIDGLSDNLQRAYWNQGRRYSVSAMKRLRIELNKSIYNEENEEFKNDIKLLIQVAKQIKDFKNSQNQVAIDVLHDTRNTLRFRTYNIRDDRFDYTRTMCLWTDINKIIDKQIEYLKGE